MANKSPLVLNAGAVEQLQSGDGIIATAFASSGSVVLSPSGTGAVQIGTGGNARGQYAVDMQGYRVADTQVASGKSSFVAGERNTATHEGAGCLGVLNTSSELYTWCLGLSNTCSGRYSQAMGYMNVCSQQYCFASGNSNTVSGFASICIGAYNTASGAYSIAFGMNARATRRGQYSQSAGKILNNGDAQTSVLIFRNQTSDANKTELFLDGVDDRLILPPNTSWTYRYQLVGRCTSGLATVMVYGASGWGVIDRDGSNNTTLLHAVNEQSEATPQHWIDADDTNESLKVSVNGEASCYFSWVCTVWLTELTGTGTDQQVGDG